MEGVYFSPEHCHASPCDLVELDLGHVNCELHPGPVDEVGGEARRQAQDQQKQTFEEQETNYVLGKTDSTSNKAFNRLDTLLL